MSPLTEKKSGLHVRFVDNNPIEETMPTFTMDYEEAAKKFDLSHPPRRPNRCTPAEETSLDQEISMWEDLSDECLENFELGLETFED